MSILKRASMTLALSAVLATPAAMAGISGKLLDKASGAPISTDLYPTVFLYSCSDAADTLCTNSVTNAQVADDGSYSIDTSQLATGTYQLGAYATGYGQMTLTPFSLTDPAAKIKQKIKMVPYVVTFEDLDFCTSVSNDADCAVNYTLHNVSDKSQNLDVWAHVYTDGTSSVAYSIFDWGASNTKPIHIKLDAGESAPISHLLPTSKGLDVGSYGYVELFVSKHNSPADTVAGEYLGQFDVTADGSVTLVPNAAKPPAMSGQRMASKPASASASAQAITGLLLDGNSGEIVDASVYPYVYLYACDPGETLCSDYMDFSGMSSSGRYAFETKTLPSGTYQMRVQSSNTYGQRFTKPFAANMGDNITKNLKLYPSELQFSQVSGCTSPVAGETCTLQFTLTNTTDKDIKGQLWAEFGSWYTGSAYQTTNVTVGGDGGSKPLQVEIAAGASQTLTMPAPQIGAMNAGMSISITLYASRKNNINDTIGQYSGIYATVLPAAE